MSTNIKLIHERNKVTPYPAPFCRIEGGACGSYEEGFSLWVIQGVISDGAELLWDGQQGDEALFIVSGAIADENGICRQGGAIVVEAKTPARLRAIGVTEVVHFGPCDPASPSAGPLGAPRVDNHRVHLVDLLSAPVLKVEAPDGSVHEVHHYADSTCPTCRLALFKVHATDGMAVPPHHHTEDEIIHVLKGEMRVGTLVIGRGESLAIKRDTRYSFRSSSGLEFLNYRRDASYIVARSGDEPVLETMDDKMRALKNMS